MTDPFSAHSFSSMPPFDQEGARSEPSPEVLWEEFRGAVVGAMAPVYRVSRTASNGRLSVALMDRRRSFLQEVRSGALSRDRVIESIDQFNRAHIAQRDWPVEHWEERHWRPLKWATSNSAFDAAGGRRVVAEVREQVRDLLHQSVRPVRQPRPRLPKRLMAAAMLTVVAATAAVAVIVGGVLRPATGGQQADDLHRDRPDSSHSQIDPSPERSVDPTKSPSRGTDRERGTPSQQPSSASPDLFGGGDRTDVDNGRNVDGDPTARPSSPATQPPTKDPSSATPQPADPSPTPANPDPTQPADPAPTTPVPPPTPVDPDPTPVDPDPTQPADPDPTPVDPTPTPTQPADPAGPSLEPIPQDGDVVQGAARSSSARGLQSGGMGF